MKSSNYNPGIKSKLLERIFGYSRTTFRRWEEEASKGSPTLTPVVLDSADSNAKPRRLYHIKDVLELYKYIKASGESIPETNGCVSIAVWTNKGGVGKTTIVQHLASTMSILMGLKVLVIDADSQSDLTLVLDCQQDFNEKDMENDDPEMQPTLRELAGWEDVNGKVVRTSLDQALKVISPTLHCIPADEDLGELDLDFQLKEQEDVDEKGIDTSKLSSIKRLIDGFKEQYDVILFDCAPNKGLLNLNILWACDRLLIPIELESKCIHTLRNVLKRLKKLKQLHENFSFDKILVLPNKFQAQKIKQKALYLIQNKFPEHLLSSVILPLASVIDKCANDKEPIFMHATNSSGANKSTPMAKRVANDFWILAHEILNLKIKEQLFPEAMDDLAA